MYTNISWKYTDHLLGIEWSIKATMSCFCFAAIEQISPATWDAILENSEIFSPNLAQSWLSNFWYHEIPRGCKVVSQNASGSFRYLTKLQSKIKLNVMVDDCCFPTAFSMQWFRTWGHFFNPPLTWPACGSWGGLYRTTPPVLKRGCCSSWRKLDKCSNFWASSERPLRVVGLAMTLMTKSGDWCPAW